MRKGRKLLSIFLIAIMSMTINSTYSISSFALPIITSGDFKYEVISETEKTAEITEYIGSETDLTIPIEIDGYTVMEIGGDAFYGCKNLISVTIPEGVTSIGGWAFASCTNLTSLTIPNSVTSIGSWAFSWCSKLIDITIPDDVTSIEEYSFYECTSLTSITVSDKVTKIGNGAFYNCINLKDVYYNSCINNWNKISIESENPYPNDSLLAANLNTLDHDFEEEYTIDVSPRNDGETGWQSRHCTRCDETIDGKPVHDDTHIMSDTWREGEYLWVCMGYYYLDCQDCTYSIQKEDDMHGELAWNEVEATCTMDGYGEWICARCTGRIGERTIYEATGHNWSDWEISIEPTCKTLGEEYRYCSNCWDGEYREIPMIAHSFSDWSILIKPTIKEDGAETRTCHCGATETRTIDCLEKTLGDLNKDGVRNSKDTGLLKYDGTWYYVNNGIFDFDYTGLVKHTNGVWYYIEDGVIDWSYSGLWKHNGTWYYVQKGQINWKFTGLVKHTNGTWYYVQGAKINWGYTGLVKHNTGSWFYVQKGQINFSKTGLVKHTNGTWYYVQNGKLNWNKTGLVKHTDGNWYYVQKGQINWKYTGLVKHTNGKWYYVQKGKLNWKYTGYTYYNGKRYKVVNGVKV